MTEEEAYRELGYAIIRQAVEDYEKVLRGSSPEMQRRASTKKLYTLSSATEKQDISSSVQTAQSYEMSGYHEQNLLGLKTCWSRTEMPNTYGYRKRS